MLPKENAQSKNEKIMDLPGFEPGAFRMQSERDTTTLQTQGYYSVLWITLLSDSITCIYLPVFLLSFYN